MRRSMVVRTTAAIVGGFAALSVVGACSGSGSGSQGGGGAAKLDAKAGPASAQASSAAPADGGGRVAAGAAPLAVSSAKIRTAQITVAVRHGTSVGSRADLADEIAVRAGGEIDSDDRTTGRDASATLVLRVPPQRLDAVLDEFGRQLGRERARHLSTQDVTARVADVTSRVTSAQQAIARLRQLYLHAGKVSDVIAIESELSTRESDLESLQAQQRALARQTSSAVVTLTLLPAAAPLPPPAQHRSGFVGGLENGWSAFTATLGAAATGLGAVLPFLALVLVLAVAGRLLWRLWARRPASSAANAAPPATE